ncbi:GH32 C-terminal domain-containing protein [Streptomyces sp. IB2014 016-6]|uniref:GH32 C-terminal domain-containing protein n=1 Tax=Streptomyces sp. IB2014 016-6 TaxID=2517818 RepID=UPI0011C78880|nr:GH32 C-terminal domain-containing protein [Streptomyces sp. IB2014 016-6]TXL88293.1 hypothetical protein EW053_19480 [Streptomyces sp. IB2014 016-6]
MPRTRLDGESPPVIVPIARAGRGPGSFGDAGEAEHEEEFEVLARGDRLAPDGSLDSGGGGLGVCGGSERGTADTFGIHKGPLTLSGGNLTLDVFLDRSMIEAYANSHKSITTRAYPFRQDSLGLRLFGDGSVIKSMTVWKMGNMTDCPDRNYRGHGGTALPYPQPPRPTALSLWA